jgi:hypothetical protein
MGEEAQIHRSTKINIIITAINDAPIAQEMTITVDTDEDKSFKGALLASDVENDA